MLQFYLILALVSWTLAGLSHIAKMYFIPVQFSERMEDLTTIFGVVGGFSTVLTILSI